MLNLATIGAVVKLLCYMKEMDQFPELADRADHLLRPRFGLTDKGLQDLPPNREALDVTLLYYDILPCHCKALRVMATELNCRLGMVSYQYAQAARYEIKKRDGPDGPELYRDVPAELADHPPTTWITILIQEQAYPPPFHAGVVMNWYTGSPLAKLVDNYSLVTPETAVRVHA